MRPLSSLIFIFSFACVSAQINDRFSRAKELAFCTKYDLVIRELTFINDNALTTEQILEKYALLTIAHSVLKNTNEADESLVKMERASTLPITNPLFFLASSYYMWHVMHDPDLASQYCLASSELTNSSQFELVNYIGLHAVALSIDRSEFANAQDLVSKIIESLTHLSTNVSDSVLLALALDSQGQLALIHHDYEGATKTFLKAHSLYSQTRSMQSVAGFWHQINQGVLFESTNRNELSLQNYERAFLYGSYRSLYLKAVALNYLGLHYTYIGRQLVGLSKMVESEKIIATNYPQDPFMWHIYFYRSNAHTAAYIYDSAYYYLGKSLEVQGVSIENFALSVASSIHTMISQKIPIDPETISIAEQLLDMLPTMSHGKLDLMAAQIDYLRHLGKFNEAKLKLDKLLNQISPEAAVDKFDYQSIKLLIMRARLHQRLYEQDNDLNDLDAAFDDLDEALHRILKSKRNGSLNNLLIFSDIIRELFDDLLYSYSSLQGFELSPMFALLLSDLILLDEFSMLPSFFKDSHQSASRGSGPVYNSFALPRIQLDQLKDRLQPEEIVIQFYDGPHHLYAFSYSREFQNFHVLLDKSNLTMFEEWQEGVAAISEPNLQFSTAELSKIAYSVFKIVLEPIINTGGYEGDTNKLTIIPDRDTHHIPFDMLCSKLGKGKENKAEYLLYDYSIRYVISLMAEVYLDENVQSEEITTVGIYANSKAQQVSQALVSDPTNVRSLPALNVSDEIAFFEDQFQANKLVDDQLHGENMEEFLLSHDLIHFASHALINPDFPLEGFIQMGQGYALSFRDITDFRTNAALIVISACDSGAGTEVGDEGMITLAKAFSLAGCPAVVMSRWELSDRISRLILLRFYDNMIEGMTKSEALRQAKIHYLKNTDDPLLLHPYFWAPLSFIGSDMPLKFDVGK